MDLAWAAKVTKLDRPALEAFFFESRTRLKASGQENATLQARIKELEKDPMDVDSEGAAKRQKIEEKDLMEPKSDSEGVAQWVEEKNTLLKEKEALVEERDALLKEKSWIAHENTLLRRQMNAVPWIQTVQKDLWELPSIASQIRNLTRSGRRTTRSSSCRNKTRS